MKEYGLIYLATPYSKYEYGLQAAFEDAACVTARMLRAGYRTYSPIVHTHPIAVYGRIDPYDHAIWLPFDEAMMEKADTLFVATMAGWEHSTGIKHEIEFFAMRGKPIYSIDPVSLSIHPFYLPPEKNTDGETDRQAA